LNVFSGLPISQSHVLSPHCEREKKDRRGSLETSASRREGIPDDSLATFSERLRDLCQNNSECHGQDRTERIHAQAQQALALAAQFGCLKEPLYTWLEFLALCPDAKLGTEHMVDLLSQ
jgi:type VI protein secretion system component VasK